MDHQHAMFLATTKLEGLHEHRFNILSIAKPTSIDFLSNLGKIISKLSPLMGNLIEFNTIDVLNTIDEFGPHGHWERQDPGFPDAIFRGNITPTPGFEIKAWFPFATEMTARFRESQTHFPNDETSIAILAWLPEYVLWGQPKKVGVCIVSALSVAQARDTHYHNPPTYLVFEPEDTTDRTRNLQQTNTNGYSLQENNEDRIQAAEEYVRQWGENSRIYSPAEDFQNHLRELRAQFNYRLDTNFAKIDRIEHNGIERFKNQILHQQFNGRSIEEWAKCISNLSQEDAEEILNLGND